MPASRSPFELLSNVSSSSIESSSIIPPVLLSSSFLRNPDRFILVGSPFIPQLQTLAKAYPNPALPLPAPIPITLKKNLAIDEDQGEMITTVRLRVGIDTLYLPLLDALDIDHFIGWQGNHALRQIALAVGDIESLSKSPLPLSPAAQIISGLPQLETVYAVEAGEVGQEQRWLLEGWREKYPEMEWEMVEVPEIIDGPPPGDAIVLFGGYSYPDEPWDKKRAALVERHWEEHMAETAGSKPRLECRDLKRKYRQRSLPHSQAWT